MSGPIEEVSEASSEGSDPEGDPISEAVDEVLEEVDAPRDEVRASIENLICYHVPTDEAVLSVKKKFESKDFSIPDPQV